MVLAPTLAEIATLAAGQIDFERLDVALRSAPALSSRLLRDVTEGCTRLASLRQSGRAAALDRLVEAGAWTDAALGLLKLELPSWTIRRLVREGDEWFCTLSRQPNLPIALDEPAEAAHAELPLAILRAFVEARRRLSFAAHADAPDPQLRPAPEMPVCCDNFA